MALPLHHNDDQSREGKDTLEHAGDGKNGLITPTPTTDPNPSSNPNPHVP